MLFTTQPIPRSGGTACQSSCFGTLCHAVPALVCGAGGERVTGNDSVARRNGRFRSLCPARWSGRSALSVSTARPVGSAQTVGRLTGMQNHGEETLCWTRQGWTALQPYPIAKV